jgi:hypothetical protein
MWHIDTIAKAIADVLTKHEAQHQAERAVYGVDSLNELALHELIASGLSHELCVAREVHYPSHMNAKLTHRQRCDLVVTPAGRPLRQDARPAGLFDPPDQADASEALWLELKIAYQFREGGVRHGGYSSQWRNDVVKDLQKMEAEPLIQTAALCLIVFTESQAIVTKDIELFEDVLVRKQVLAGFRAVHHVPLWNRIGHGLCTVALWPTLQRTSQR